MDFRRKSGWLLSVLLVTLMVVAPAAGAATNITHLSVIWQGAAWHDWLRESAEEFMKLHPDIQVDIAITQENIEEVFVVSVAGGAGADVVELGPALVPQGYFVDLRPYIERDEDLNFDDFYPYWGGEDGAIFALPTLVYPHVTYYNYDYFVAAGVPTPHEMGDGWTWEAVLEGAPRLTVDPNGDGETDRYAVDRIWSKWNIQVRQAGGNPYNRTMFPDRAQWNDEKVVQGLEYISTFFTRGYNQPFLRPGWDSNFFWHGRSAMSFVDGPGIIGPLLSNVSFTWDVAPQPKGPDNDGTEYIVGDALKINRQSAHVDEAYAWISYLASPERMARMAVMTGNVPPRKSLQAFYLESVGSHLGENGQIFFDVISNPDSFLPYTHSTPRVAEIENEVLWEIWRGNHSAETAVSILDERLNAVFASLP